MEINRNNVIEIVNTFDTKPDKDYGQNFLIDANISEKIVNFLNLSEGEKVLEVGPGIGSLTHFFINKKVDYIGVDIDYRMINYLKHNYKEPNINFAECDIRNFKVSEFDKILGNLPYNITTETITYLLSEGKKCKKFILMCQSDTFAHFIDITGKEYGPTSVLIHLIGTIKPLFIVRPGSFYPSPKCNSTVFEIIKKEDADIDKAVLVYKFAKQLFSNRRKTILNNLNNLLGSKELTVSILNECDLLLNLRPEQIPPAKFNELFEVYNKRKNK